MTHATSIRSARSLRLATAALFALACLAGCGAPKVQVKTAARGDLRALKTYAWYPDEGDIVGLSDSRTRLAREVMRKSIDEGLRRNGLRPVGEGAPADVFVVYQLGVRSRREVTDFKTVERNGETVAVPDEFQVYRGGRILIFLIDPRIHDTVWVGTASAENKATDSDSVARSRLEHAVGEIFNAMKKDRKG